MNLHLIASQLNSLKLDSIEGQFVPAAAIFLSIPVAKDNKAEFKREALVKELVELGIIAEEDKAQITLSKPMSGKRDAPYIHTIDILASVINQETLNNASQGKDEMRNYNTRKIATERLLTQISKLPIQTPAERLLTVQKFLDAGSPTDAAHKLQALMETVVADPGLKTEFDFLTTIGSRAVRSR